MCARKTHQRKQDPTDPAVAYARIARFCAYQERSHKEVKEKLAGLGLDDGEADALLARLITDGYVNEERFAKAFAGGKFRIRKWGRIRIEQGLQSHGVSSRCIAIGLKEIDEDDYRAALRKLVSSKANGVEAGNEYQKWDRVSRFAIGKGYEPDLVWEIIKELRR